MGIDAYTVAVKISLVENVTRGLMLMGRHFRTTDAEAKVLESRLKSIGKLALGGGLLVGAGAFGLKALQGPLDEAKKYQTEMTRFASLGFGDRINGQADSYARAMRTIGTSTTENLSLVSDAMAVFKNLDHAKMAAPIMAQMKFANSALFGAAGGANDKKFMDLLKVVEFRGGLSSDAEFKRQADFAQKVLSGSRGRVDASALLAALKTGGVALSRRQNEAFYLGSEPLIQEFGGSRYGTAAMSIYQNLVQSRGTITAQQELYRLGLLDPKMVQFNNLGMLKKARPGAFKGSDILENQGELALLKQVLLPAFAAKGITGDEAIIRELGMILGNRTGSSLMSRIYQQRASIENQSAANRHAMGIGAMNKAAAGTLAGKEIDFEAKLANLKLALGAHILPMAIKGLDLLNGALDKMAGFANRFPTLTGGLIKLFAAVSGLAVVGGGLMLVTAAFQGLALIAPAIGIVGTTFTIIAGVLPYLGTGLMLVSRALLLNPIGLTLTAIAGAVYLLWKNWDWIGPKLGALWDGVKSGVLAMVNYVIGIINHIPGVNISPVGGAPARNVIPPRGGAGAGGVAHVYMDGKKVGSIVSGHLGRAANRPSTGSHFYDTAQGRPSMLVTQ